MSSINDIISLDSDTVADSLSVMILTERTIHRSRDYLNRCAPPADDMITESDRMILVDWCYCIVDSCQFDRETVAMAMGMVDRFLSNPSNPAQKYLSDGNQYQLLAISALYIATKINEPVPFSSDVFAETSDGVYSAEEIEGMELTILRGLGWRAYAPTSIQMAYHILSLVFPRVKVDESTWEFILDEVRFQAEYAVRDYFFTTRRTSTAAVAAIFNSLDQVDSQVRREIIGVLLLVMNDFNFASVKEIFAAKNRLESLVNIDEHTEEDDSESESMPQLHDDQIALSNSANTSIIVSHA